MLLTLRSPAVTICTTRFNIKTSYRLSNRRVFVFCVDLRTNSDYFLYSINWLVFITETQCVYCAVRTGSLYVILRSAHTAVFMCFVCISEQTAIISLYNIYWLIFINETECVYCAVRTQSHKGQSIYVTCLVIHGRGEQNRPLVLGVKLERGGILDWTSPQYKYTTFPHSHRFFYLPLFSS